VKTFIVFLLDSLEVSKDQSFKDFSQLRVENNAQVLVKQLKVRLLHDIDILVGATANDSVEQSLIGSQTSNGPVNHAALGLVGRTRQELQGGTKIPLASFALHDILELLAKHFLVLDGHFATHLGCHGSHGYQEASVVGTKGSDRILYM
jgi:hypothetical protein